MHAVPDDELLAALGDGARTYQVAARLGMPKRRPYVLRQLLALEASGRVRRNERFSAANCLYWEAVPLDTMPSGQTSEVRNAWD